MDEGGAVLMGSEGLAGARTRSVACLGCGRVMDAVREWQMYCSDACRANAWRRRKLTEVHEQARLDFTPASSEHAHALRGRETKAQRILARLRQGPATTWDLQRITGRFSARLQELEERGLKYERQDFKAAGQEHSVYTMTREPREE